MICIEMFVAAVAHAYVFPPRDYYTDEPPPNRGLVGGIRQLLDWNDVWEDATGSVGEFAQDTHQEIRSTLKSLGTNVTRGVKAAISVPAGVVGSLVPGRGGPSGQKRPEFREFHSLRSDEDWHGSGSGGAAGHSEASGAGIRSDVEAGERAADAPQGEREG